MIPSASAYLRRIGGWGAVGAGLGQGLSGSSLGGVLGADWGGLVRFGPCFGDLSEGRDDPTAGSGVPDVVDPTLVPLLDALQPVLTAARTGASRH